MSEIAYIAGLLAAFLWGVQSILSKRGLERGGNPFLLAFVVVITGTTLTWGALFVLDGPGNVFADLTWADCTIFLVGGLVGTALGRIYSYNGVDRVGASINSAVVATSPVFATVFALLFLGETVALQQGIGIVIVIGGLIVLTFSRGGDLGGWTLTDLLVPLTAALAYGSGYVIRRFGLVATTASPLEATALNEIAALVGLGGFLAATGRLRFTDVPVGAYAFFVGTGVMASLGLVMLFVGLNYGQVAVVTTLSGTSALFATILSYVFLQDLERITLRVILGAFIVVAGVSAITFV